MTRWMSAVVVGLAVIAIGAQFGACSDGEDDAAGDAGAQQSGSSGAGPSGGSGAAGAGTGGGAGASGRDAGSGSGGRAGTGGGDPSQTDAGSATCEPPCADGERCELVQVTCVRAPCPPQPMCVQASGSGQSCGSRGQQPCPDGEYCDHPIRPSCGAADAPGQCRARPDACTRQYDPVCGCDGQTYGNACEAAAAGVSVSGEGECDSRRAELHDCDLAKVACEALTPGCPDGQVPSVNGICYGPCVDIEQCACSGADDCPEPEQYTCHLSAGRCGPYV